MYPSRTPRDDDVDVFGLSHQGKVRKENQDHYLIASFHQRINVVSSNLSDLDHGCRVSGQVLPGARS